MARRPATPAARRTSRRHIDKRRCRWARATDPDYIRYHDEEWGRPVHEDRRLFEMLTLEGAQAGLSWSTILRKRAGYRRAFANFDPRKVARFDARRRAQLRRDAGIVRNRLKIDATVSNAQAFLAVQREFGSFDRYLWSFVCGKPLVNRPRGALPAYTPLSDVGVVNDHSRECFRCPPRGPSRRARGAARLK